MPYAFGTMAPTPRLRHLFGRPTRLAPFFALLVLLACGDGSSAGGAPASAKLDFRLKTTDGRTLGPPDFPGKVVVVDFWATWCAPCRLQARILEPVVRELKGKNVQFLAADMGEEEATVRSYLRENPFGYPVLLDVDSRISDSFNITALPTLLIIDRKGGLFSLQAGLADGDTLKRRIQQAGS